MRPNPPLAVWLALVGWFGASADLRSAEPAPRANRLDKASAAQETEHWAFLPPHRPAVPSVRDAAWVRTPIDAFLLAELEKRGLKPAPPADKRTLLRRVYLDLIGLPPTLDEQRAFLQDTSPDAYRKVVNDLLARPQYGERWARHWLDVARYAETNGYERDGTKPNSWRYRDYVINAFNRDKPYDQFVREQLAGDEIDGANAESHIATTFLRLGTWDDEPAEPLVDRYDQLDDVLGTTATAFLGLTLRCARCHDHKFEPFTQDDYYRMLAVFEPLKRPQFGRIDLDRLVGTAAELAAYQQHKLTFDAEVAKVQEPLDALKQALFDRVFVQAAHPSATRGDPLTFCLPPEAVTAFRATPAKRSAKQNELVLKMNEKVEQALRAAESKAETTQREQAEKQLAAINATRPPEPPRGYVWYEDGMQTPPTKVFKRGDPLKAGKVVEPGLPVVLDRQPSDVPKPRNKTTGRRLWLARWLTQPTNPLTARVMVNRIWQHHFGAGLVASANDFGVMGDAPSHPALLDWLATEFVAPLSSPLEAEGKVGGWRLKPLQRLLVLSNAYQMSSAVQPEAARLDAGNRLLWRWRQRRLEAEAIRDSVLAVSGQLNLQTAGSGAADIFPSLPRAVLAGQSRPGNGWGKSDEREAARRSIYIFVKRVLAVPELELLDMPDNSCSCEQRLTSTVAPQALTLLNGDFMRQQARHFAARLQREAGDDEQAQIRRAFELALCRTPRPEEAKLATAFLRDQLAAIKATKGAEARSMALAALCLVILNTNEFVYWD